MGSDNAKYKPYFATQPLDADSLFRPKTRADAQAHLAHILKEAPDILKANHFVSGSPVAEALEKFKGAASEWSTSTPNLDGDLKFQQALKEFTSTLHKNGVTHLPRSTEKSEAADQRAAAVSLYGDIRDLAEKTDAVTRAEHNLPPRMAGERPMRSLEDVPARLQPTRAIEIDADKQWTTGDAGAGKDLAARMAALGVDIQPRLAAAEAGPDARRGELASPRHAAAEPDGAVQQHRA